MKKMSMIFGGKLRAKKQVICIFNLITLQDTDQYIIMGSFLIKLPFSHELFHDITYLNEQKVMCISMQIWDKMKIKNFIRCVQQEHIFA